MTPTGQISASYDRVAMAYTAHIADELASKPLDRALLTAFAEQTAGLGPLADLGCGPGHVAAFLAERGASVTGFDLSPGMVAAAAQRSPHLRVRQGDLRALDVPDATFGGVVAFYSIIHLTPDELAPAFREWHRVLRPGGRVLVAFHSGDQVIHLDSWWEQPVDLDFRFWQPARVTDALRTAGFAIEALVQRAPYPDVEHPSERAYVLACRKETVS